VPLPWHGRVEARIRVFPPPELVTLPVVAEYYIGIAVSIRRAFSAEAFKNVSRFKTNRENDSDERLLDALVPFHARLQTIVMRF
jgi:hypothetical protein